MKTILSILLAAFALPAMAGDSEDALRKQLASLEKQIHQLRATQKSLYEKHSAVRKQLHTAESRAKFLKRFDANGDGKVTKEEAKAVLAAEAKKRAAEREKKK